MTTPDVDQLAMSESIMQALGASPTWSAAGATGRGRYQTPPRMPFVALSPPGISSEQGPVMGQYTRHVVYDVQAWAQASSLDQNEQVVQAEELLDELLTALEQQRKNTSAELYRAIEFVVRTTVLLSGLEPLPTNSVGVFATIELTYRRVSGLRGAS